MSFLSFLYKAKIKINSGICASPFVASREIGYGMAAEAIGWLVWAVRAKR